MQTTLPLFYQVNTTPSITTPTNQLADIENQLTRLDEQISSSTRTGCTAYNYQCMRSYVSETASCVMRCAAICGGIGIIMGVILAGEDQGEQPSDSEIFTRIGYCAAVGASVGAGLALLTSPFYASRENIRSRESSISDNPFNRNTMRYLPWDRVLSSWLNDDHQRPVIQPENWGMNSHQSSDLKEYLGRLTLTSEAKHSEDSYAILKERVRILLTMMENNPNEFRSTALDLIQDGVATCIDRIIATQDSLDIMTRVHAAEHSEDPKTKLTTLGTSLLALEIVRQHEEMKIEELEIEQNPADPVEIRLAYETSLADTLNLPIYTRHMTYREEANVSRRDIKMAEDAALEAINDSEKVKTYLASWDPMQRFERKEEAAKELRWENFPALTDFSAIDLENEEALSCPITQEVTQKPILVGKTVYDYDAFMQWWSVHGTNPLIRQEQVDLKDVFKIELAV